jgi:hypothetical protein
MMQRRTVVEMPDFMRRAKSAMTDQERTELIDYLSANPDAGDALGGDLYKVRFARAGGGKSGGFRTIHYYNANTGPLFLLTMFARNEKSNLSKAETDGLMKLGRETALWYGKRQ